MKKTIYILLGFTLCLGTYKVSGQHKQIDSLNRILKQYTHQDTVLVTLFAQLAYAYYRTDADSTLFFATKSKELAEKINYPIGIARALRQLSIGYWVEGEYNKTIQFSQEAITIFKKHNDNFGISGCYNGIGLVYYRKKEYEKALDYFEKGLALDTTYHYEQNKGIKLTNIGIIYSALKKYELALTYLFKSLVIHEKIHFEPFIPLTLRHIGEVYLQQKEYAKAELFGNKTLQTAKKIGSDREITLAYLLVGKIAKEQKQYQKAELLLVKAYEYAYKTKEIEHDKETVEALYELYKAQNNMSKALKYNELFKVYQDCLHSERMETEVKNLEFSYQLQLKEQEILVLKKDKLVQESAATIQRFILVGSVLVGLFISIVSIILFRGRQKDKKANILLQTKNTEILQQQQALTIQAQQLQQANELKSKLFSIIAHDLRSPLNTLEGLLELLSLDGLTHEESVILYKDLTKQLNGLQSTLANLLQWAKSHLSGIVPQKELCEVRVLVEDEINLLQVLATTKQLILSNEVPTTAQLYADSNQLRTIFRNLLANAIKFTQNGGKVAVKAIVLASHVEIQVEDSGIGMTKEQLEKLFGTNTHFTTRGTSGEKGTGLGLIVTKEFIEKNGGILSVTSTVGLGTTFSIKFTS